MLFTALVSMKLEPDLLTIALCASLCAATVQSTLPGPQPARETSAQVGACIALGTAAMHSFLDEEQMRRTLQSLSTDYVPQSADWPATFKNVTQICYELRRPH